MAGAAIDGGIAPVRRARKYLSGGRTSRTFRMFDTREQGGDRQLGRNRIEQEPGSEAGSPPSPTPHPVIVSICSSPPFTD